MFCRILEICGKVVGLMLNLLIFWKRNMSLSDVKDDIGNVVGFVGVFMF